MLSSDWKKTQAEKQNNFVISSFILVKRAAKWQLLTLSFRKSEDENKSQMISRKFTTSPDILVAKGRNSVANATVLVAISSPDLEEKVRTAATLMWSIPLNWNTAMHASNFFFLLWRSNLIHVPNVHSVEETRLLYHGHSRTRRRRRQ